MSGVCIVNLKKHDLEFKEMDELANRLVKIALKDHVAVFFHSNYGADLIKALGLKNYFVMSDSFVYRNCDFLDVVPFIMDFLNGFGPVYLDDVSFREAFKEHFNFFNEMMDCIFKFAVSEIEIYISPNGFADTADDFEPIQSDREHFIEDFYNTLYDELGNHFNYEFLDAKFEIKNPNYE